MNVSKGSGAAVVIVVIIVVVVGLFLVLLTAEFQDGAQAEEETPVASYDARAAELLAIGNAEHGAQLVVSNTCTACHREGAVNGIAPAFVGVAERAESRLDGFTAEGYILASILNPSHDVVEGYQNVMPQNYATILSDQDLADILAYLMQPDAH